MESAVLGGIGRRPVRGIEQDAHHLPTGRDLAVDLMVAVGGPQVVGGRSARLDGLPPEGVALPAHPDRGGGLGVLPGFDHAEPGGRGWRGGPGGRLGWRP